MTPLSEAELLQVWEDGMQQAPAARALQLAALAAGTTPGQVARLTIGARDGLLFGLHETCFGPVLRCEVDCPTCDDRLAVQLTTTQLRSAPGGPGPGEQGAGEQGPGEQGAGEQGAGEAHPPPVPVDVATSEGWLRVRPVTGGDLLGLAGGDPRRALAARCLLQGPDGLAGAVLSDAAVDAVAAALAEADPTANLTIRMTCGSCGHEWTAPFDIGGFLWAQVDGYARQLLFDVHCLARAYGWSEQDVLAVSPGRRRLYLEAVAA